MQTKRGTAWLILLFSTNTYCENMADRSCRFDKCSDRFVREVTTGMIGSWQPSVHSEVACWSFDVKSSYHWDGEVRKSARSTGFLSTRVALCSIYIMFIYIYTISTVRHTVRSTVLYTVLYTILYTVHYTVLIEKNRFVCPWYTDYSCYLVKVLGNPNTCEVIDI